MMEASPIVYLALVGVVPFSIAAFALLRPVMAILVIILGSAMFLPEKAAIDGPLIPPLDKHVIPMICIAAWLFLSKNAKPYRRPSSPFFKLVVALWLITAVATTMTNKDSLSYGPTVLPGIENGQIITDVSEVVLRWLLPFGIGWMVFRTTSAATDLLRSLAMAGLVYTPFILVELRFSPQWHNWVYGYAQHSWLQVMRDGGFRAMVFMQHGLTVAMFMWTATVAAWSVHRLELKVFRFSAKRTALWFTFLFPFLKSLGALVYAIVAVPLMWFTKPRTQLRIAALLALIVAVYPIWRTSDAFPQQAIVDLSARVNQDRAGSLEFRLQNESMLEQKALKRQWFGWGGWGRYNIYDEEGKDISITDGAWIIFLGEGGICGLVFRLGLMVVPIWLAWWRGRGLERGPEAQVLSSLSLICAFSTLDLLPNGLFNFLPIFFGGALMGLSAETVGVVRARGRVGVVADRNGVRGVLA